MRWRQAGLWRHKDFLRLWIGQTISQFGSQIGGGALGLTAILTLRATPVQLGLLAAVEAAPVLLLGLLAGVWVDRMRRRPILIGADIGRALLLLSIPLAALTGLLLIEQLYVVAALVGILMICFDVAYESFLPSLVQREHLMEGNSTLGMSSATAEIAGPAIGGGLVQLIGGPLTILVDAISFLCSALFVGRIRTPELSPAPERRQPVRDDLAEGLRAALGNPLLRALLGSTVTFNLAGGMIGSMYGVYAIRELGLQPAVLGLIVGVGGAGALAGAFLAEWTVRRFGLGTTLIGALAVSGVVQLLIPLAHGPPAVAVSFMISAQVGDIALAIYFINELSLRQTITPNRLLGRVNASMRFVGAAPGRLVR